MRKICYLSCALFSCICGISGSVDGSALNASIEKNPVCYENQDLGCMKEYFAEPYEAGIQLRSSIIEFRYWAYHFALAQYILKYNFEV